MGRKPFPVDPARLEDLAREGLTQKAAALEVGLNPVTLSKKLRAQPELRAAWIRGCAHTPEAIPTTSVAPAAPIAPAGTPGQQLLAAVRRGHRTFGELMTGTGLSHDALVAEVQRQVRAGRVVPRMVNGVRHHFLAGES